MESLSGNVSDKKTLEEAAQRMQQFCRVLESAPSLLYVGDSAMYANCVKHGHDLLWLLRVPENIKLNNQVRNIVLNVNQLLQRIITYFSDIACDIYGVNSNNLAITGK